jgi:hypothetical protein
LSTINVKNVKKLKSPFYKEKYKDKIFYKERWINDNGIEQRLIITYSVKYQEYQKILERIKLIELKN